MTRQVIRDGDRRGRGLIHRIHRRRPILTAALVLAALAHALITGSRPANLLDPSINWRFWLPWTLMIFGVAVRLWGSGNLRKNEEITDRGIYALVRHPLYLGSLSFLLSYFLTVGNPGVGVVLFGVLLASVYYPTMLAEEEQLQRRFPGEFARYRPPPRLLPNLRRVPEAIVSDRFQAVSAYRNLGFRGFWLLVGLPIFLRLLALLQDTFKP